jgi:hypothetical protein
MSNFSFTGQIPKDGQLTKLTTMGAPVTGSINKNCTSQCNDKKECCVVECCTLKAPLVGSNGPTTAKAGHIYNLGKDLQGKPTLYTSNAPTTLYNNAWQWGAGGYQDITITSKVTDPADGSTYVAGVVTAPTVTLYGKNTLLIKNS